MNRTRSILWLAGLLGAWTCATAAQSGEATSSADACNVEHESLELPRCALEARDGHLYVAARFLPQLFMGADAQLVARVLPQRGWSYIDRVGKVVVSHVAVMDNYASAFHHGLVRIHQDSRWGLADRDGTLVVPLNYDGMLDYQSGDGWKACTGCQVRTDGEHRWFEGGQWVTLDRYGKLLRSPDRERRF